jgi:tetratricopeptide (TPR) repeat protein
MAKALDLDPLSGIGLTNAALIAYLARDHVVAGERVERALEIDPDSIDALLLRGMVHEASGRLDLAIDDYRAAVARSLRYTVGLAFLGHALGRLGEREEAEEILRRLDTMRRTQHVSAMDSALVALALERFDEAFQWLEAAIVEKSGWLVYLKTDRRLDPLRGDARFEAMLRKVELASTNP